jgi:hypothetical protein
MINSYPDGLPTPGRRRARVAAVVLAAALPVAAAAAARTVTWADLPSPVQARLDTAGVPASAFPAYLDRLRRTHATRIREGDLDHLVFYLLQSTHFTRLPSIEPALSARGLVESLPDPERAVYLKSGRAPRARVPPDVLARARELLQAIDSADADARLVYFRQLVSTALPRGRPREAALLSQYFRAMRFLYEKEFVAQRAPDAGDAVASLYRSRGLSTDTAIEAGYTVYLGLGTVKALQSERRVRRVLVVGPGLDLAPRTGLVDDVPPESYQPWAVIDALVGLGLSRVDDLAVVGADINPRVVDHLRRAAAAPPALRLESGLRQTPQVSFERDYRDYFAQLGNAIAASREPAAERDGRLVKPIRVTPAAARTLSATPLFRVTPAAARTLSATPLDIVTERLPGEPFDVIVATNILPYFDDVELSLALSNIAAMLAPGGVLLHNEPRPTLRDIAAAVGLTLEQSRQAPIARVTGAPPLADTVFLHRR